MKVPQWHPPGAGAEVDFDQGQIGFWLDGVLTKGWMFVFHLSARQRVPPRPSRRFWTVRHSGKAYSHSDR